MWSRVTGAMGAEGPGPVEQGDWGNRSMKNGLREQKDWARGADELGQGARRTRAREQEEWA